MKLSDDSSVGSGSGSSSRSASSSRFFPHPLTDFMRTHAALKMLLPFSLAVSALCAYSVLDRLMPAGVTYGSLEYSFDRVTMQGHLDTFDPAQYCVVGFSVGLHLFNAFMYAACLSAGAAYASLQLRAAGLVGWSRVGDTVAYMQLLTVALYFIEHIAILSQFLSRSAGGSDAAPRLVGAVSILFLIQIVLAVIFVLLALLWTAWWTTKHAGKTPLQVAEANQLQQQAQELQTQQNGRGAGDV